VVAASDGTSWATSVGTAQPIHRERLVAKPLWRRRRKTATPSRRGTPCWETSLFSDNGGFATSPSGGASPRDDTVVSLGARSNLVVVTASVKGYEEPMTILIDSCASYKFATKASVARNSALYAKAETTRRVISVCLFA
jgi:hypothetical protein